MKRLMCVDLPVSSGGSAPPSGALWWRAWRYCGDELAQQGRAATRAVWQRQPSSRRRRLGAGRADRSSHLALQGHAAPCGPTMHVVDASAKAAPARDARTAAPPRARLRRPARLRARPPGPRRQGCRRADPLQRLGAIGPARLAPRGRGRASWLHSRRSGRQRPAHVCAPRHAGRTRQRASELPWPAARAAHLFAATERARWC